MTPFAKAYQIAQRFKAQLGERPRAAKKNDTTGECYIYEQIGADWFGNGLTAKSFTEELDKLKGVKALNIYINSPGGDVWDGKAIYTALCRFDAVKTVYVDGIAASAASFIAMAGDKIVTSAGATWMIHRAWGMAMGNAMDMRATADILELEDRNISGIYERRTKQSADQIMEWLDAETWMDADTAKARGFTDEIAEADQDPEALAPVIALAAATRQRITDLHDEARMARMHMRVTQIHDDRQASLAEGTRQGQPERTVTARTGGR